MTRTCQLLTASVILLVIAGSGCQTIANRTVDADVGVTMIPAADAPSLDLQSHQRFQMASSTFEPLPVYPPEQIGIKADTISVCVEIVVDSAGHVASAEPRHALPECPLAADDVPAEFTSAALAAIRRWQFIPAEICEFPPGVETNPHCSGAGVTLRAIPIRLAYAFSFAVIDGQVQVRRHAGTPTR